MYHQFEKIGESKIRKELLEWVVSLPENTNWDRQPFGKPLTFESVVAPNEILEKCDIVRKALTLKLSPIAIILRMKPNTYYKLHTDRYRTATINLLLNDECDSFTYFNNGFHRNFQNNFVELKYEKDSYYLLDTTIQHGVINHNQWRYMFSCGFNKNYNDVLNDLCS